MNKINQIRIVSAICGILSPILYALAIIIGGVLRPGYSHIEQAVSELMEIGAPNKLLIDLMFVIYDLLMIIYIVGLHKNINNGENLTAGPLLIILVQVLSLLMTFFFPCDPGCVLKTISGIMHVILIIPIAIFNLFGLFAFWLRLRNDDRWQGYDWYTLFTLIIVIIISIISAFFYQTECKGLIQRISMFSMQQWFFFIAIKFLKNNFEN